SETPDQQAMPFGVKIDRFSSSTVQLSVILAAADDPSFSQITQLRSRQACQCQCFGEANIFEARIFALQKLPNPSRQAIQICVLFGRNRRQSFSARPRPILATTRRRLANGAPYRARGPTFRT